MAEKLQLQEKAYRKKRRGENNDASEEDDLIDTNNATANEETKLDYSHSR